MGLFNKGKKEEEFEMVMVKKKKPFYKRVWFWILIILIVIMANSCGKGSTSQAPTGQEQKQSATPAQDKKPKYEILEQSISKGEYGSRYVVGKIKNNAGKDVGYLQIEINLYDKDGNQVGSTLANINNLEKDGIWTFKAMILEENATSYKIKDVTGF